MAYIKSVWKKQVSRGFSYFVNHKIADQISKQTLHIIEKRGYKQIAIFANDYIGIQINQFGYFKGEELETLFEYLSPLSDIFEKSIAHDIGANIGNHSLFFSDRFRGVLAYEPNPRTHCLLKFKTDDLPNVICHQLGLGDVTGSFELHQDLVNHGLAFIKYNLDSQVEVVNIQVLTHDKMTNLENESICIIKMDVEGFEDNVIKGGEQTLKKHQPVVVLEQRLGEFTRDGTTPAIQRLSNLGNTFCWVKKHGASGTWLGRRIQDARKCVTGKQIEFVDGNGVPPANCMMLIAIPERFKQKMKI